jgi:hypothetical protein
MLVGTFLRTVLESLVPRYVTKPDIQLIAAANPISLDIFLERVLKARSSAALVKSSRRFSVPYL